MRRSTIRDPIENGIETTLKEGVVLINKYGDNGFIHIILYFNGNPIKDLKIDLTKLMEV